MQNFMNHEGLQDSGNGKTPLRQGIPKSAAHTVDTI